MSFIWFDFETRSSVDIDCGTEQYIAAPDADIVLLTYAIDDGPVLAWWPSMRTPCPIGRVDPAHFYYAHNIGGFDRSVWNKLGQKYGFTKLPLSQCRDTMALLGRYTYPMELGHAGRVLKIKHGKDMVGKKLMKRICSPPYEYTEEDFHRFVSYGRRDVIAMREIVKALPSDKLSPSEQKVWEATITMNKTGLPIDVALVKRVMDVLAFHRKRKLNAVPVITMGEIQTIGQTAKIAEWIGSFKGCPTPPDLRKETVASMLDEGWPRGEPLPQRVEKLLRLRQEFGRTSLAKYEALLKHTYLGRIHDCHVYHRASTGRWGGRTFQPHNLPRVKIKDIEGMIDQFYDTTILKNDPMQAAVSLIRSMVTAPKGKKLAVADYSSIENVVLAWVARQLDVVELHRQGLDEYKKFASEQFYHIPLEDVTSEQRQACKPIVLGAGYTLSWKGLIEYAKGYGVELSADEAQYAITAYRQSRPKIKKFWYAVTDCAIYAVDNPGKIYAYNDCAFQTVTDRTGVRWLTLRLPSGRLLFYCSPRLTEGLYGPVVVHYGINSYTKQWEEMKITPGRFTENIVQALARDLLAHAKLVLMDKGYTLILSVHDEVVAEVDESFDNLEDITKPMCVAPLWADGLPLRAEGGIVRRYQKL